MSFYFRRRGAFDVSFLRKNPPRTISEPLLGSGILEAKEPPVRAVWVTAANPVAMLPDSATVAKALETRELVVVVDSFLTDTGRRAHWVLPTTTLVEDDDLLGAYGHHWLGASTPALAPPAGVRSDLEIVQALARQVDARTGSPEGRSFFEGKRDGPGVEGTDALEGRAAGSHRVEARARIRPQPFRRRGSLCRPEVPDRHGADEARPRDASGATRGAGLSRSGSSRTRPRNPRVPSGPGPSRRSSRRRATPRPRAASATETSFSSRARSAGSGRA